MALAFSENIPLRVESPKKGWKPRTLSEVQASDKEKVVRVYTDGVYDLFHPGHVQQLRQAKEAFPNVHLIVGVCTDEDTLKYKGCLPIMRTNERVEMVKQCKYVDEVMATPVFFPTVEFANYLEIDLVAHDSLPYQVPDSDDCYAPFKALDRFLSTERTPNVSTTEILDRILGELDNVKQRQILRNA
uniref:choline-phosphate cytidylyltransferase n=1 Tax=Panagrellus redivivus TaxID=6233 RepID=A0A7E4VBV8_PANRE